MRIQLRRGTAAEWTFIDPVLSSAEIGVETDTLQAKIGDGAQVWSALPYVGGTVLDKADLDEDGWVPDEQIAPTITRDTELTAALSVLEADVDAELALKATVTALNAETNRATAAEDLLRTTIATNVQTGTTYTLVLTDAGKDVRMGNASASTLTVPPNSSVAFPTDTVLGVVQYGAGQVTITPGAGVTLRAADGLKTDGQYAAVTLKKLGTDEWLVLGGVA